MSDSPKRLQAKNVRLFFFWSIDSLKEKDPKRCDKLQLDEEGDSSESTETRVTSEVLAKQRLQVCVMAASSSAPCNTRLSANTITAQDERREKDV